MGAGLLAGYGTFAGILARFFYPSRPDPREWLYIADLASFAPGESLLYTAPSGATVTGAGKGRGGEATDFVALSSVCPHLGCQVHWEPQNNRFFCPCHNGVFDPSGVATEGPPAEAGQSLLEYPLKIQAGLLYIHVPVERLASTGSPCGAEGAPSGPGHDACLYAGHKPGVRRVGRA